MGNLYDVFIGHASEDKEAVARPLTQRLSQASIDGWMSWS